MNPKKLLTEDIGEVTPEYLDHLLDDLRRNNASSSAYG